MVDELNSSSSVLDLGANHGHFALAIADRFHSKVCCVEPDPRLFSALASNPKVSAINAAVATRSGSSRFYLAQNWECSSLIPPKDRQAVEEIECQAMTLEGLLATFSIQQLDVLKVDIEGIELEVLTSLSPVLDRINQLTVEFHESIGMGNVKQVLETIDYLERFGFGVIRGSFFDYSDVLFLHPERLKLSRNWRWSAIAQSLRNGISRRIRQ